MEAKDATLLSERAIWERKSTRSFDRTCAVSRECLEGLLRTAMRAPSPKNRQPWHFTVVTEGAAKERLSDILSRKLKASAVSAGSGARAPTIWSWPKAASGFYGTPRSWCL